MTQTVDEDEVEGQPLTRCCERCGQERPCHDIPMMGYSLWLCRGCAAAAYRNEEAV